MFFKGLSTVNPENIQECTRSVLKICAESATSPIPIAEGQLCSYVSFLVNQGLKHRTIKSFLSAIRHLQISEGLGDPFHGITMPKLEYVLKGVKNHQAEKGNGCLLPPPPQTDQAGVGKGG